MNRKYIFGVGKKLKNRRVRLDIYNDGGYLLRTKSLITNYDGKLAIHRESIGFSQEAMEAVIELYAYLRRKVNADEALAR